MPVLVKITARCKNHIYRSNGKNNVFVDSTFEADYSHEFLELIFCAFPVLFPQMVESIIELCLSAIHPVVFNTLDTRWFFVTSRLRKIYFCLISRTCVVRSLRNRFDWRDRENRANPGSPRPIAATNKIRQRG